MNVFLPSQTAKYYIGKALEDGELVSPLKMQKLVYYAYAWTLVLAKQRLFDERIEAWPMGPVVPTLYHELKVYGGAPIPQEYIGNPEHTESAFKKLPPDVVEALSGVYDEYMTKTAFELVVLSHGESPWRKARLGLGPKDSSENVISDEDIIQEYSNRS